MSNAITLSWHATFTYKYVWRPVEKPIELFWTFFYRHVLIRNTIEPLQSLSQEEDDAERGKMFREWSQRKVEESKYIQIAAGLLFTSITSCLQWPSTQTSHWSAPAMFYTSLLFALLAIVNGSQQLLLLNTDQRGRLQDRHLARSVKRKIQGVSTYELNTLYIYALQAPLMLLTFAVMTFLAGVCSVIFSPLAQLSTFNDEAKVALVFGIGGVVAYAIFYSTSLMLHALLTMESAALGLQPVTLGMALAQPSLPRTGFGPSPGFHTNE